MHVMSEVSRLEASRVMEGNVTAVMLGLNPAPFLSTLFAMINRES